MAHPKLFRIFVFEIFQLTFSLEYLNILFRCDLLIFYIVFYTE